MLTEYFCLYFNHYLESVLTVCILCAVYFRFNDLNFRHTRQSGLCILYNYY